MKNHIICKLSNRSCKIDGEYLDPKISQKIVNHSLDGFAWGYCGSGPAQLALAILYHMTYNKEIAVCYYQQFKYDIIAKWDFNKDVDYKIDIMDWLNNRI